MRSGSRWRWGRRAFLAGPIAALAAGCARDPVDAPVQWWHNLEGGAIAEQRPPPPGVDAPYPHVGTTPGRPAVPSVAARDALTEALTRQRYASTVTDTRAPIVVQAAPPSTAGTRTGASASPTPTSAATPTPSSTASATPSPSASATLDTAGTPAPGTPPAPPKPVPTPEEQERGEPVLAMPAAPAEVAVASSVPLPTMPRSPPSPPEFADFPVPTTSVPPIHPDFGLPPPSDLVFEPGSDVLLASSHAVLVHAATGRGTGRLRVAGYGDTSSDAPADQEAALRLALARATAIADALERMGVPPGNIVLAASAFGRGGDVTVLR